MIQAATLWLIKQGSILFARDIHRNSLYFELQDSVLLLCIKNGRLRVEDVVIYVCNVSDVQGTIMQEETQNQKL